MAGTINSLGLGSGVLTSDLIDKLKANDESLLIKPIDNKIALNQQKTQAMSLLNSLLTTFKSSVSALDGDTLYQNRTVTGNNNYASVTAASGSQVRNFSLEVTNLAQKNVLQSGAFNSTSAIVANGNGKLNVNIAGKDFAIDYTSTTTLTDLKDRINDAAGSAVTASILQTGTSAYSLVVTSKETGKNQVITMSDLGGNLSDNKLKSVSTETGSFLAKDDFIATGGSTGSIAINVGGTNYNFAYDGTTTLQQLVDSINNDSALSPNISASIVQYGANDYRMVLTPKSGVSNTITITDNPTSGGTVASLTTLNTTAGGISVIQDSSDALFKFDGITLTRSKNTITDIASGLTVNLLQKGGSANISITQNQDQIATELEGLVTSYNSLQQQLKAMTGADLENGKVGIFNGDNSIRNIGREITKFLTKVDINGYSLAQYGIDLNRDGVMSLNKTTFMDKMSNDPVGTETFFSGKTTVNSLGIASTTDGMFTSLNNLMKYYTGSNGLMTNLTTDLETGSTSLSDERKKALKLLDARYNTLSAKFAAYDGMISKLNSQFSSLKQQIDAMANNKN